MLRNPFTAQCKPICCKSTGSARVQRAQGLHKTVLPLQRLSLYSRRSLTLTPSAGQFVRVKLWRAGLGTCDPSMSPILCKRRIITYASSVSANCCPMQIRGPPLNGRYSHPGRRLPHRSGRNWSASSPQRSFRRCII